MCGVPLFAGQNDIDQLYRVLKIRGTPSDTNWPGHNQMPDWGKIDFPTMEPVPLRTLCHQEITEDALSLLDALLTLDPAARITAARALEHEYFDEIRTAKAQQPDGDADKWHEETLVSRNNALVYADAMLVKYLCGLCSHRSLCVGLQLELATFPAILRRRQQLAGDASTSTTQQAHSAAIVAPEGSKQKSSALESTPTPQPAVPATDGAATPSESPDAIESRQLLSMHLSGIEWNPLSSSALTRAAHAMPGSQMTLMRPQQPFRMSDICAP